MSRIPIFEKKNVLITGGAGFIGSYLCEALLKEAKVICVDDLSGGRLQNIEHLLRHPDFEFIKHDISEPIQFDRLPELARFKIQFQGIQEIYHLACPTAPKEFEQSKIRILRTSAQGTMHMLDLATKWHAKVLLASSSVIYGPRVSGQQYVSEDHEGSFDHLSSRASYDEGKRFAETTIATYRDVYGIEIRIGRIFRTYGPRVRLGIGEMIPDFIVSALEGKPLTVYGDENFLTSLCYVSDIVDGLQKLMHADRDPGPVNLGSDQEYKIDEVAKTIIALTKSSSKVVFEPPLLFMRPQPTPSITRARQELGWFPVMRLEDGLKKMIEYASAQTHRLG